MTTPTYLVIGDLTRDLLPDGSSTLGGTALYAAATATRLGVSAAIFTSGNPSEPPALPKGIAVAMVPCNQPSTFENRYTPQGRLQLLHARGAALQMADLPVVWRDAPLVHLGPLTGEFGLDLAAAFPSALVAVTPQGWMRHWDLPLPSPIRRVPWHPDPVALAHVDLLVLSIEDVGGDVALVAAYAQHCRLVALTRGAAGSTLYIAGTPHTIPAYPAEERDPTGAGDVFAAALLIHLHHAGDPLRAATFASAVAAYAVEGRGITHLPTWEQAMARNIA